MVTRRHTKQSADAKACATLADVLQQPRWHEAVPRQLPSPSEKQVCRTMKVSLLSSLSPPFHLLTFPSSPALMPPPVAAYQSLDDEDGQPLLPSRSREPEGNISAYPAVNGFRPQESPLQPLNWWTDACCLQRRRSSCRSSATPPFVHGTRGGIS